MCMTFFSLIGCVNADVEPVKNTLCIKISGSLTVYSNSNDDNIKTLVGEMVDTELRKVLAEAGTFKVGTYRKSTRRKAMRRNGGKLP